MEYSADSQLAKSGCRGLGLLSQVEYSCSSAIMKFAYETAVPTEVAYACTDGLDRRAGLSSSQQ
jgi:hypothetical protein